MQEWLNWFFDGIGSQIICLLIGGVLGGIGGFYICKYKGKMNQKQIAGSDSEQLQQGIQKESKKIKNQGTLNQQVHENLEQVQKAKDYSKQTQIGRQENE